MKLEEYVLISDIVYTKATHVRYDERTDRFIFFNDKGTQTSLSGCLCPSIPRDKILSLDEVLKWKVEKPKKKCKGKQS